MCEFANLCGHIIFKNREENYAMTFGLNSQQEYAENMRGNARIEGGMLENAIARAGPLPTQLLGWPWPWGPERDPAAITVLVAKKAPMGKK